MRLRIFQGCRFPGCANTRFLHVRHRLHGGRTSLDNLVLLWPFHHHQIHEGGFSVGLTADAEIGNRGPDGTRLPTRPMLAANVGAADWQRDRWDGTARVADMAHQQRSRLPFLLQKSPSSDR